MFKFKFKRQSVIKSRLKTTFQSRVSPLLAAHNLSYKSYSYRSLQNSRYIFRFKNSRYSSFKEKSDKMCTITIYFNESDRSNTHLKVEGVYPDWLSAQFFTEHLQQHYNNSELDVIKVVAKPISARRDSFLSSLYRGNVIYSTKVDRKYQVRWQLVCFQCWTETIRKIENFRNKQNYFWDKLRNEIHMNKSKWVL